MNWFIFIHLQWFQKEFDVKLPIVAGAITPPHISDETLTVLRRELMSYRFDAILGNLEISSCKLNID